MLYVDVVLRCADVLSLTLSSDALTFSMLMLSSVLLTFCTLTLFLNTGEVTTGSPAKLHSSSIVKE